MSSLDLFWITEMIKNKRVYQKIIIFILAVLILVVVVYAGVLGEHHQGDTGTDAKNTGSSNTSVYDGGRSGGKTENTNIGRIGHSGQGDEKGDSHKNNSKQNSSRPLDPPVVVFRTDSIENIYLLNILTVKEQEDEKAKYLEENAKTSNGLEYNTKGVYEGLVLENDQIRFEVQRLKDGSIVEKVEYKTRKILNESVKKVQSNHIEDGFINEQNEVENTRFNKILNNSEDELQNDTNDLKKLFENASIQANENEEKNALENLAKLVELFNQFQKDYANLIGGNAAALAQTEKKMRQNTQDFKLQTQKAKVKPNPILPTDEGILQKLQEISMSFLNLIFGGTSDSFLGVSFKKYFDQFSSTASSTRRGDPYVNEALQKSGLVAKVPVIKSIGPVRDRLIKMARTYLAPGMKIQYSQNPDKRNGPLSFDCSGFVSYVYGQMGLNLTGPYGRAPTVRDIISTNGLFHEVNESEAQVGDLVVHLGEDSNHVGIYSGKDGDGNVKEISATTRNKAAKLDPFDPRFKSSVTEHPAIYIGRIWYLYRWKK